MCKNSTRRVLMAKKLATQWLVQNSSDEFRVQVYPDLSNNTNLPRWLRAFRDGHTKLGSLKPFDFAVETSNHSFSVRSRNKQALVELVQYLEKVGYMTSGIW